MYISQLTAPQHEYRPTSQLTHDPLMRSEGINADVQPRHISFAVVVLYVFRGQLLCTDAVLPPVI